MNILNEICILTFSLSFLMITAVSADEDEILERSFNAIPDAVCKTIRFHSLNEKCHHPNYQYPVKSKCTKYIECDGELVPREYECPEGTIFAYQFQSCYKPYPFSTTKCVQTYCANKLLHNLKSKPWMDNDGRTIHRQYPSATSAKRQLPIRPVSVQSQSAQSLLNCNTEQGEDEDELEFGPIIPTYCPPGSKKSGISNKNSDNVPNWNNNKPASAIPPTRVYQHPSNVNSNFLPQESSRSGSLVYGNREAGRTQAQGYENREAGREQQNRYGNPDPTNNGQGQGQGQGEDQGWQWQKPVNTSTEYYVAKQPNHPNPNQGGGYENPGLPEIQTETNRNEYPPFPNGPDFNDEEDDVPIHQSQTQNGNQHRIATILFFLPFFLSLLNYLILSLPKLN